MHHSNFAITWKRTRVTCEQWRESGVCESCLESMLANQSEIEQRAILESMIEAGDPLLVWKARERLVRIDRLY